MGERFPGDLALLCGIARPDVGVVTNVGYAHAEHLGGPDGAAEVIGELMAALPETGTAVLDADDPYAERLAGATAARVLTVSETASADYRIESLALDAQLRPTFRVRGTRFSLPLHGGHHAKNAALAIAVAHGAFGIDLDEVRAALDATQRGRWRMELLEADDGVIVLNDAYNANPTSMEAALSALAHLQLAPPARRVAVLGDMRELGAHHDEAHRAVGQQAAALGIDLVVGVGDGGALIAETTAAQGIATEAVPDAAAALAAVDAVVRPGDAVLVKGSRAVGLEAVAGGLLAARRARAGGGAA
jgi:UDP-N-acetylmuramoyl-tripeptide--D-alanyl-D-alanine ligase